MNLARSHPRALHQIDTELSRSDPWLAAEFARFGWLTQGAEMPQMEQLGSVRRELLALLLPLHVIAGLGVLAAGMRRRLPRPSPPAAAPPAT